MQLKERGHKIIIKRYCQILKTKVIKKILVKSQDKNNIIDCLKHMINKH